MLNRRELLTGTALGALSALGESVEAAPAPQSSQTSDRAAEDVARAVQALRDEIVHQNSFWEVTAVRDATLAFLRSNGKFPISSMSAPRRGIRSTTGTSASSSPSPSRACRTAATR